MWPSTYLYRREIRTLGKALNSRYLRFVARTVNCWTFEQPNTTTDFISYFFIVFAVLPDVNPSWLIDWITFIGLQYLQELGSGEMTIFYCWLGQQTDLLTVRATFLQIKQRSSEVEGVQQWDIRIQVSRDKKQSILGSNSTILHPLTEVRSKNLLERSTSQICWPLEHHFLR